MLCHSTCRILERAHLQSGDIESDKKEQRFEKIDLSLTQNISWREKVRNCFLSDVNSHISCFWISFFRSNFVGCKTFVTFDC